MHTFLYDQYVFEDLNNKLHSVTVFLDNDEVCLLFNKDFALRILKIYGNQTNFEDSVIDDLAMLKRICEVNKVSSEPKTVKEFERYLTDKTEEIKKDLDLIQRG